MLYNEANRGRLRHDRPLSIAFGLDGFGCFYYGNHAMFTRTALAITRSGLVWSGSGPVGVWQETGEVRGWFKYIQVGWWQLVHSLPGCFLRDDSGDE